MPVYSSLDPTWYWRTVDTTGAELSWWSIMCNPLSKSYSTILISWALEAKKVSAKSALVNIFSLKV